MDQRQSTIAARRKLSKFTVVQLKQRLKAFGLPVHGKKSELVKRLQNATISGRESSPLRERDLSQETQDQTLGSAAAPVSLMKRTVVQTADDEAVEPKKRFVLNRNNVPTPELPLEEPGVIYLNVFPCTKIGTNEKIAKIGAEIDELQEDYVNYFKNKGYLELKIEKLTRELEVHLKSVDIQNKNFQEIVMKKSVYQCERNVRLRFVNAAQENLVMLKQELLKTDQGLRSVTGKAILNGQDSVRKVLQTFREKGDSHGQIADSYYGMLIENFGCNNTIYTAVEVTSGNKLFYHIVENEEVGIKILQEMNRQQLPGEVSFMPLDRLTCKDVQYPNNNEAIPMISQLTYKPKHEKAIKSIFGKTLICRNLKVAAEIARTSNLDCITLDGDQVSHKGVLTRGYFNTKSSRGYFNSKRSKLDLHRAHVQLNSDITKQEKQLTRYKNALADIEAEINEIVSEIQGAETKKIKNKDFLNKLKASIHLMKEEVSALDRSYKPKKLCTGKERLDLATTSSSTGNEGLYKPTISGVALLNLPMFSVAEIEERLKLPTVFERMDPLKKLRIMEWILNNLKSHPFDYPVPFVDDSTVSQDNSSVSQECNSDVSGIVQQERISDVSGVVQQNNSTVSQEHISDVSGMEQQNNSTVSQERIPDVSGVAQQHIFTVYQVSIEEVLPERFEIFEKVLNKVKHGVMYNGYKFSEEKNTFRQSEITQRRMVKNAFEDKSAVSQDSSTVSQEKKVREKSNGV